MTDEHDLHGYPPIEQELHVPRPLTHLWTVRKGDERRVCVLHSHQLGFEVRIADEHGHVVFAQVEQTEPECVFASASQHDWYLASGWVNDRPGV